MREVRTIEATKSLESYFEAFSFTGSQTLELEAEVETCLDRCRPVQCQVASGRSEDDYETVASFGRRRRRSLVDPGKATRGDIVQDQFLRKALVIVSPATTSSKPPVSVTTNSSSPQVAHKVAAKVAKVKPALKRQSVNGTWKGKSERKASGKYKPTASSLFAYQVDSLGYFCFEPNTLTTISGVTLITQAFLVTCALLLASKFKRRDYSGRGANGVASNHQRLASQTYFY